MCVRLSLPSGEGREPLSKNEQSSPERFSSSEYPLLAERLAQFTRDPSWPSAVILHALQDAQREVWGILVGGLPQAFYVIHVGPFELEIEMIAVASTQRRRGLATRLLRHAQSRVTALEKEALLLEVRRSNSAAQQLYAAEGMQQNGLRKGYYPVYNALDHDTGDDAELKAGKSPAPAAKSAKEDALLFSWAPSALSTSTSSTAVPPFASSDETSSQTRQKKP